MVFDKADSMGQHMAVACGQCIGCRIDRSKAWAIRCVHEASLHDENSFLTLTYDPQNVPPGGTLVKKDHRDFLKRLRRRIEPRGVRYFHCGEYGDVNGRPHYHTLLFGFDFSDKSFWKVGGSGERLYRSEFLEQLWPVGFSSIGAVNFASAAYVARYILKKVTGERAEGHYGSREPEYISMSLKPAIGSDWYGKFKTDLYPSDFAIAQGKKYRVPSYYDCQLEKEEPDLYLEVKQGRRKAARQRSEDNTPERLAAREKCLRAKVKQLPRSTSFEEKL